MPVLAHQDIRDIVLGLFAFGAGLCLFFWGLREYWREKLMKNTPLSKVNSVALGLAELQGHATPLKTLTAPIERKACVYWHYEVEELRQSGKSSQWVTISEHQSHTPFYIEDDTGKILVDPDGAEVDIPKDLSETTGVFDSLSPCTSDFAQQKGYSMGLLDRKKRFTEWIIEPGDPVFVFGTVTSPKGQLAGLTKTEDRIICDVPANKFFLIADKTASEVERQFAWRSFGGVFGGAALALAGLAIVLFLWSVK